MLKCGLNKLNGSTMTIARIFVLLSGFVFLAGCASTFETRPFAPTDAIGITNGLIYYETAPYLVRTEFTSFAKDGQPTTSHCISSVQKIEVQFHPGRKMVVIGHPSDFSTSSLAVTLAANGTLVSINAASSPVADKLIGTLELAVKDFAIAAAFAPGAKPPCNSDPTISLFAKINDFSEIPALLRAP
jgi:hypothetical protein